MARFRGSYVRYVVWRFCSHCTVDGVRDDVLRILRVTFLSLRRVARLVRCRCGSHARALFWALTRGRTIYLRTHTGSGLWFDRCDVPLSMLSPPGVPSLGCHPVST